MGDLSTRKVDSGTKVGVSGGGEFEVTKVKRLSYKIMIFTKSTKQASGSAFWLLEQISILFYFIVES